MELKCSLVTKISKDGEPYQCIVIQLTDDYEKVVYLDRAEKEIMKLASAKNSDTLVSPFNV